MTITSFRYIHVFIVQSKPSTTQFMHSSQPSSFPMSGNVCVSENCTTAFHPRGIRFSQNVREMMVLWVPHDFFHVAPQFGNAQLVDFFVGQQDLMIFYGCTSKSWKKSKKSNPPSMGIWGPTCEPPRHLPGHRRNLHDRPRPHRLTGSDRLKKRR